MENEQIAKNRELAESWFNYEFQVISKEMKPYFHGAGYEQFLYFVRTLCKNNFTYQSTGSQNNPVVYSHKIRNVFDDNGNIVREKLTFFFKSLKKALENMHKGNYNEASEAFEACFDEQNENDGNQFSAKNVRLESFVEDKLLNMTNVHGYSKALFNYFAKQYVKLGSVKNIQGRLKVICDDFDKQEEKRDKSQKLNSSNNELDGDNLVALFGSEEMDRLKQFRKDYLNNKDK